MGIEELMLDRAKKQGIQKGLQKGIQTGEYIKAIDIAIEMKKDGLSVAQIRKFTKLSLEEIEKL